MIRPQARPHNLRFHALLKPGLAESRFTTHLIYNHLDKKVVQPPRWHEIRKNIGREVSYSNNRMAVKGTD